MNELFILDQLHLENHHPFLCIIAQVEYCLTNYHEQTKESQQVDGNINTLEENEHRLWEEDEGNFTPWTLNI